MGGAEWDAAYNECLCSYSVIREEESAFKYCCVYNTAMDTAGVRQTDGPRAIISEILAAVCREVDQDEVVPTRVWACACV